MPIIASTATTLAAFLPLAFWPGIMGEFMKYMPITLIIVLTSSLIVALVINTVFTSRFMKVDTKAEDSNVRARKRRNILIGSAVLILVAVVLDTLQQIESHLLMRRYDGLVKEGRLQGRSRLQGIGANM